MSFRKSRRQTGVTIAECAASLSLMLPIVITLLFVVLEASYAYLIKNSMAEAARQAARDLSIAYAKNPQVASDRSAQNASVYNKIRIRNMINNSQQFDDAQFDTGSDPPTVSVKVRYLSGQFGLPTFPNPDFLNLGSRFRIDGDATYRLE
jgi:hypothetical protein